MVHDVIIIGSGPAGLTAAIYATRANLKTLVVAGQVAGGQLMITTDVENYPGFPDGILGPELMDLWRKQAERFGAEFVDDDATKVDFSGAVKKVWVYDTVYQGKAVIIATGATAKWLGLESEERLKGHGVSACATCDGFFFKDMDTITVGGGDAAMEESLFLAGVCKSVTIVHRRDEFRASKIMQDRVLKHPKIKVLWNTGVEEILGDKKVSGVRLRNNKTGKVTKMPIAGVFIAIGHKPATEIFDGVLPLDRGYIPLRPVDGFRTTTEIEGVFAAGDVHDHVYRQAVTAAGYGCMAALDAQRWLESKAA